MPKHYLGFVPSGRSDGDAELREEAAFRGPKDAAAAETSALPHDDQHAHEIADIERAVAALRKAEPAPELWSKTSAGDPPEIAPPQPRLMWTLIGALGLLMILIAVRSVLATSYLTKIDLELFRIINGLCGRYLLLDHVINRLDDAQLKGLAFMSTFGVLWFQRTKAKARQRETLILLLLALVLSLILSRALADVLPFRLRPMFMPGIGYRALFTRSDPFFEDWSSFPSDTAAVIFVMTIGFWLLSRWWGLLWVCFSITAITARVCLGLHYPSDVVAGALIGVCMMIALNNEFMHARIASPIVSMEQHAPAIFYGLLFPFIYEVATLFSFIRSIRHTILHVFIGG
jgi:undecaprenyl-diphosphatase